jgi:hypothetical protein
VEVVMLVLGVLVLLAVLRALFDRPLAADGDLGVGLALQALLRVAARACGWV